jgi:hypothetical protein
VKVAIKEPTMSVLSSAWTSHKSAAGAGERALLAALIACDVPVHTKIRGRFGIARRIP